MYSIKNFVEGSTAYLVEQRNLKYEISEVTVKSVGRTYVTIDCYNRKFKEDSICLEETTNIGRKGVLLKSRRDAEEYIEREYLTIWLIGLNAITVQNYSLEQLRKVREILEGKTDEKV